MWWRHRRRDEDFREEVEAHLALETERLIADGRRPGDARDAALRSFGNVTRAQERFYESLRVTWLDDLQRDLRYALRNLRKNPGLTATAVLSLALGIGANTAIFSLMDALMLRWLPVRDPQELVQVRTLAGRRPPSENLSYSEIRAVASQTEIFSGVAGYSAPIKYNIGLPEALEQGWGGWVSGEFYQTLGIVPITGRLLGPNDNEKGGTPVAVISADFWQRRFDRDPQAIGQKILIEGVPVTIIGVTAFAGATVGGVVDLTMPLEVLPQVAPSSSFLVTGSGAHWMRLLARPRTGISLQQAKARLAVVWPQLATIAAPDGGPAQRQFLASTPDLVPGGTGTTTLRRQFRAPLQVLMVVVGLVLLIACANLANLLLARASARRQEIGVRLAIGAGRGRIIRQLLTESGLLATFGAALGIVGAWFGGNFLVTILSTATTNGSTFDLTPNWHILGFTTAVAIGTTFLFGLLPAFVATAQGPAPALKDSGGRVARTRLASSLVTIQVALSLVLLIGAGLFVRTLQNLRNLDLGFRREGVLIAVMDGQRAGYRGPALVPFYKDLVARIETLPGVASASLSVSTPLGDLSLNSEVTVGELKGNPQFNAVTPTYFDTIGIPLVQGRRFTFQDDSGAPRVAAVNEAFVRRFFPDGRALGQHVTVGTATDRTSTAEIVAVVNDTIADSLRRPPSAGIYFPYFQSGQQQFNTLEVRASGSLTQVADALRGELRSLFHSPVDVRTLDAEVEKSLVQERLMATVAGAFGVLALVLAAVGLYGLLTYGVARQTKEIGIRMALGADGRRVLRGVIFNSATSVAAGFGLGLAGAWVASRWIESMLFRLKPTDPATIGGAAAVLIAISLAASYLPARRASRVDPMTALRHE
jgi:predicted permease